MADRSPPFCGLAAVLVAPGLAIADLACFVPRPGRSAGSPPWSVPNFKNTRDPAGLVVARAGGRGSRPHCWPMKLAAEGDLQVVGAQQSQGRALRKQELHRPGNLCRPEGPNAAQRGQMTGRPATSCSGTVSSYDLQRGEHKLQAAIFACSASGTKKQQVETRITCDRQSVVVDAPPREVAGRRTVKGASTSTAEAREPGGQAWLPSCRRRPACCPETWAATVRCSPRPAAELRLQRSPVAATTPAARPSAPP